MISNLERQTLSEPGFFSQIGSYGRSNLRSAFQQVLLAVISSCNMTSNSQTGKESANSQNNSAAFYRINVKKPSGKGKWGSNWGDRGVCFMEFPGMEENHGMD
jgi:hypothetical protein